MRKTYKKQKGGGGFFSKEKNITVVNERKENFTKENPLYHMNKSSIPDPIEDLKSKLSKKVEEYHKLEDGVKKINLKKNIIMLTNMIKELKQADKALETLHSIMMKKKKGGEWFKKKTIKLNDPIIYHKNPMKRNTKKNNNSRLKRGVGSRELISKMTNKEIENRNILFEHYNKKLGKSNSYSSEIKRLEEDKKTYEIVTNYLIEKTNAIDHKNKDDRVYKDIMNSIKQNKIKLENIEKEIEVLKDNKRKGINYRYKNISPISNDEGNKLLDEVIIKEAIRELTED